MSALDPYHLLLIAIDLAEINTRRPRRADLCRAASTAYYALFHCLARTCADSLAGRSRAIGSRPLWLRVYRALEHRQTKTRCENLPPWFPDEMQRFADSFANLQSKRHVADYDPDYSITKADVVADINDARAAIDGFLGRSASDRRDFAIHVLMKVRANA